MIGNIAAKRSFSMVQATAGKQASRFHRMKSSTTTGRVPEGVAAPQNNYRDKPEQQAEKAAKVWYQRKRVPLYVAVTATLVFAGLTAKTRTKEDTVQTDPKMRNSPVLEQGEGNDKEDPENVQIVSKVAKWTGNDKKINPQGAGVDPKKWEEDKAEYRKH